MALLACLANQELMGNQSLLAIKDVFGILMKLKNKR